MVQLLSILLMHDKIIIIYSIITPFDALELPFIWKILWKMEHLLFGANAPFPTIFSKVFKLDLNFSWICSMLSKNRKWFHDLKIAYGVKGKFLTSFQCQSCNLPSSCSCNKHRRLGRIDIIHPSSRWLVIQRDHHNNSHAGLPEHRVLAHLQHPDSPELRTPVPVGQ